MFYNRGLTLGFSLVIMMLLPVLACKYAGGRLGHADIGTLTGFFLGLLWCGYELWRTVREIEKSDGDCGCKSKQGAEEDDEDA